MKTTYNIGSVRNFSWQCWLSDVRLLLGSGVFLQVVVISYIYLSLIVIVDADVLYDLLL